MKISLLNFRPLDPQHGVNGEKTTHDSKTGTDHARAFRDAAALMEKSLEEGHIGQHRGGFGPFGGEQKIDNDELHDLASAAPALREMAETAGKPLGDITGTQTRGTSASKFDRLESMKQSVDEYNEQNKHIDQDYLSHFRVDAAEDRLSGDDYFEHLRDGEMSKSDAQAWLDDLNVSKEDSSYDTSSPFYQQVSKEAKNTKVLIDNWDKMGWGETASLSELQRGAEIATAAETLTREDTTEEHYLSGANGFDKESYLGENPEFTAGDFDDAGDDVDVVRTSGTRLSQSEIATRLQDALEDGEIGDDGGIDLEGLNNASRDVDTPYGVKEAIDAFLDDESFRKYIDVAGPDNYRSMDGDPERQGSGRVLKDGEDTYDQYYSVNDFKAAFASHVPTVAAAARG